MTAVRRLAALLVAALALVLPALAASPASAASGKATVSVFHGIPKTPVDIYVNGEKAVPNFQPGDIAGPLSLDPGTYAIEIKTVDGGATVFTGDQPVEAGMNYTIAAYLGTDGKPAVKAFVNDTTTLAAGQARVTVRHLANAPTVAITANGNTLVPSISNGNEAVAEVPADTYDVGIKAGDSEVAKQSVKLAEGANTIVYAYGTYPDTFALGVQTIDGLGGMPSAVPAGDGGAANDALPVWVLAAAAGGLVLAGAGAVRMRAVANR